jgi:hypothetical protein
MIAGLLSAAAGLVRLYGLITTHSFRLYDAYHYVVLAQNLAGFQYSVGEGPHPKYLPLYPLLILLLRWAGFASLDFLTAAKLVSFLASSALAPLIFALGLRLGLAARWAVLAALLQISAPLAIGQSGQIFSEPLFAALLVAAILSALSPRPWLTGLLLGLSCLTRYEGFLFFPCLAWCWRKTGARSPFFLWSRLSLAFALVYWPWARFILIHLGPFIAFSYPMELFLKSSHPGLDFITNAFAHLTAGVALLGTAGFFFLPRGPRALLGGFTILFVLLHCYWPYNNIYFVVSLLPFFNLAAACFFQRLAHGLRFRSPRQAQLALAGGLAGLALPLFLAEGEAVRYLLRMRLDPSVEIIRSLPPDQRARPLIGFIEPLLSRYHGGPPMIAPEPADLEQNPHEFVLKNYLDQDARTILWSPVAGDYRYYFGFLVNGEKVTKEVDYQQQRYRLTYTPIRFFKYWNQEFILYRIKAKPLSPSPPPP